MVLLGCTRFPGTLYFIGSVFAVNKTCGVGVDGLAAASTNQTPTKTNREGYDGFVPVDAVYALPVRLVEQLGLKSETREARPLPPGETSTT